MHPVRVVRRATVTEDDNAKLIVNLSTPASIFFVLFVIVLMCDFRCYIRTLRGFPQSPAPLCGTPAEVCRVPDPGYL